MGEYNGVIGGVSAIATDGFTPWWNGIDGTVDPILLSEGLTIDEAYEHVLDWKVAKHDVHVNLGNEELPVFVKVEDKACTVREDTLEPLGIVGSEYGVTQNEVLRDFGKALKRVGDVYVTSAGTLFGSRVPWILCKLGEDKHFGDGDETIQRYLLIASSHDGSMSLSVRPTNVRVECMNTFDWAIKGTKSLVSLRHTSKIEEYLPQAMHTVEMAYAHFNALDDEIQKLITSEYDRGAYTDMLVPTLLGDRPEDQGRAQTNFDNRFDAIVAAWDREDQGNIKDTKWGALMAVNSFEQWSGTLRGQTRSEAQAKRAIKSDFPLTDQARKILVSA